MSWFASKKEKIVDIRSSFFRKLDDKKGSTESAPVKEKDLQIPGAPPSPRLTTSLRTPPIISICSWVCCYNKLNNVLLNDLWPLAPAPAPDDAAATPAVESAGHRTDRAADKLATALAAKYQFELNPSRSHKANVHALLSRELHDLTRQALAFRTARLPPRVLCRLNAFIANLCAAVPESPLPSTLSRLSVSSRSAELPAWDDGEDNTMMLAQVSEEDLKKRLECYISALWATANAATQAELAKEAYKGNPKVSYSRLDELGTC